MFKPLPSQPNFPEQELAILDWWKQNDIVNQYLHKNDSSDKTFSFIDGPITANGPMGVHHARGRALKDLYQRYKNAQGFAQRFQMGFDCQGLWVEVEVEKDAGFNSKKDIIDYGLDKFTDACMARIDKFSDIQTEQSKRLGMFADWDNSYYTNSVNNNLYIWHFLKAVHQKGWLTRKKSAATWCPRCETGLSQHEQADGYKDITDTSVYLKFKLSGHNNEYLLAWTTTPWTLTANVLLAINTKFSYVKAKSNGEYLYLAKDSADRLGLTDYETIDASTLLNKSYESIFNLPAQAGIKHFITNWDLVDPVEGSGVVHIAPGCGQEDFELGKELNSDMIAPLNDSGHFLEGFGEFTGLYAHDVAPKVFEHLKQTGSLFKTESITHRYPHCWRCKTKCLFRLEDGWYIKSDEIRSLMKEAAKKVSWHPKYIGRRMQNWLDTMEDWMISRKRFYGLALPFYPCSCGELTVVGSREELKQLSTNPNLVDNLTSFHRPWIDEVEICCPKCGKSVKRVADVGDCWLDAGVVPFSTLQYLTNKDYWKKWFPADLVLEMVEQVRLWFYSMLFFGVTLENSFPYTNVVAHAEVRDEKGERISKTKKNGIPYNDAVSTMGADAMRWLYCQQKSHTNVMFGYNIADQVKRDFLLILWNSYRFYTEHANLDNWSSDNPELNQNSEHILDQWLVSRLNTTIKKVTLSLDKFTTPTATKAIEEFVSDLSTWYIRRSRDRSDNYDLLYSVFDKLCIILAPFTPFLAETIYQNLHHNQSSVHLQNWPQVDEDQINLSLEDLMSKVRQSCQQVHALRQKVAIKVRQPLLSATITSSLPENLIQIVAEETNVKSINIGQEYQLNTNITPELQAEGEYRDFVRSIQIMRREAGLNPNDKITIQAPNWPKQYEADILSKTAATNLVKANIVSIEKIS